MPRVLCILAMVIAGLVFLLFLLDLALGFPFQRAGGLLMDIGFLLSAAVLAYLSWATFRQLD